MLSKQNIAVKGILKTTEVFGKEYVRNNYKKMKCEAISSPYDGNSARYFIAFEGDGETNLWTVFACVEVLESGEARMLDYKLPDGTRMHNPIEPIRLA